MHRWEHFGGHRFDRREEHDLGSTRHRIHRRLVNRPVSVSRRINRCSHFNWTDLRRKVWGPVHSHRRPAIPIGGLTGVRKIHKIATAIPFQFIRIHSPFSLLAAVLPPSRRLRPPFAFGTPPATSPPTSSSPVSSCSPCPFLFARRRPQI